MNKYNDFFIGMYDVSLYFHALNNPSQLLYLNQNFNNRYFQDLRYPVYGDNILFLESLDHYVTKRFLLEPSFRFSIEFNNYVNYFLVPYLTNCINGRLSINNNFFNNVGDYNLRSCLSFDFLSKALNIKQSNDQYALFIMNKIRSNQLLNQSELMFICDYYAFNRDKNDVNHKDLIEYLINVLTRRDNGLVATPLVCEAIMSYVPKIFDIDGIDFSNVRIVNDDLCNSGGCARGTSIVVDRKRFYTVNFKSTSSINKESDYTSNEFVTYFVVLFHELAHIYQFRKMPSFEFNDEGFMSIINSILNENLHDYPFNHDSDQIEIDATRKAWLKCADFFRNTFKDQKIADFLFKKCNENSVSTHFRRTNAVKINPTTRLMLDTDYYDIENLNCIVKRYPGYIQRYPMLSVFYNFNGDLDFGFLSNPKIKNSVIGKNYIKYVLINYPDVVGNVVVNQSDQQLFSLMVANIYDASMDEVLRIKHSKFDDTRGILSDAQTYSLVNHLNRLQNQKNCILCNAVSILSIPGILYRTTNVNSPEKYLSKLLKELSNLSADHLRIDETGLNTKGIK